MHFKLGNCRKPEQLELEHHYRQVLGGLVDVRFYVDPGKVTLGLRLAHACACDCDPGFADWCLWLRSFGGGCHCGGALTDGTKPCCPCQLAE